MRIFSSLIALPPCINSILYLIIFLSYPGRCITPSACSTSSVWDGQWTTNTSWAAQTRWTSASGRPTPRRNWEWWALLLLTIKWNDLPYCLLLIPSSLCVFKINFDISPCIFWKLLILWWLGSGLTAHMNLTGFNCLNGSTARDWIWSTILLGHGSNARFSFLVFFFIIETCQDQQ